MNTLREAIAFNGQVTSLNSVITAVTEAITRGATKILFDKSKPYILLQRPIKEDEEETTDVQDVFKTARLNEMREFNDPGFNNLMPYEYIFEIFRIINDKELFINYILVKDKAQLEKWLNCRISNYLLNAKVLISDELDDDVVLFCGSENKIPDPYDIKLTIKGYMTC